MHKTTNHSIRILTLSALGLFFMVSCLNINVEPLQESTTLKADEKLMQKADSGDVKAQNELGQFYAEKGYYPQEISEENLTVMDPVLFTDPNGLNLGKEGSDYSYTPANCNNGKCKEYTLRAKLEKEDIYTKKNRS